MRDAEANQQAYPQHSNQTAGCGFPLAKIVVMFSLVTGALMSLLIESLNSGELVMSYVDLVLVKDNEADAVKAKMAA
jgi:hypothetical protein